MDFQDVLFLNNACCKQSYLHRLVQHQVLNHPFDPDKNDALSFVSFSQMCGIGGTHFYSTASHSISPTKTSQQVLLWSHHALF